MSLTVATARQSQLVTTYGVGSLFPAQNESFMVMGLDHWTDRAPTISEPRLARALNVHGFRAPPAGGSRRRDMPVIRFPDWHFCPHCRRLDAMWKFTDWRNNVCPDCNEELVPSRFVICCSRGHIDEFPYFRWLHTGGDRRGSEHSMTLTARGRSSSLSDILISCSCGTTPVSLEGAFDSHAMHNLQRCRGRRPWLGEVEPEECSEVPRTLQRGSSNVWFPITKSAISIPPWSEGAFRIIDRHWTVLQAVPADALERTIKGMRISTEQYPLDALVAAVMRARGEQPGEPDDLKAEEYKALCAGRPEASRQQDFVCTPVDVAPSISDWIVGVSQVSRLREVRALTAFTRIKPASYGTADEQRAPLAAGDTDWLPAIQVIGEGIFVRFDQDRLTEWETSTFAAGRAAMVQGSLDERSLGMGLASSPTVSPRQLLLHSFAHALIDQLSLDAGYGTAALRERLYHDGDMAGVLIYTASSDSAGSLGGVAAQSAPDRFERAVLSAVARMAWCSSDPVCIETTASGSDALNLAACHSCLLLPETSCESSNTLLDRATLVGTPGRNDGFLSPLLGP